MVACVSILTEVVGEHRARFHAPFRNGCIDLPIQDREGLPLGNGHGGQGLADGAAFIGNRRAFVDHNAVLGDGRGIVLGGCAEIGRGGGGIIADLVRLCVAGLPLEGENTIF